MVRQFADRDSPGPPGRPAREKVGRPVAWAKLTMSPELTRSSDRRDPNIHCDLWEPSMPIRCYIEKRAFGPEAINAMNEALEAALAKLEVTNRDDPVATDIA